MPGVQTNATQSELDNEEQKLRAELRRRAVEQLSEVSSKDNVHVRDILPDEDLESGGDNGWNGTDREWTQGSLNADSEDHIYTIDPDNGAEKKLVGIYAIESMEASPSTTEVVFKDATGSTFERANVQSVIARDREDDIALLENPILVNVDEEVEIHAYHAGAAGEDEQLVFHGATAEKRGKTLGERA